MPQCRSGRLPRAATARWRARSRAGAPVVTVPAAGDMAENGARAQWAGAGLNLPGRFLSATTLRWAVERALERPRLRRPRAGACGLGRARNDGAENGRELVERFAAGRGS